MTPKLPLTPILHTAHETPSDCSRRREEADSLCQPHHPPPHVGGYQICEILTPLVFMFASFSCLTGAAQTGAGWALSFNGTSSYVRVATNAIPTSGNFSIEGWLNTPSSALGSFREILSQAVLVSPPRFYLGIDPTGQIRAGDAWTATGVTLPTNAWHHLALVRTNDNTFLYLDGALAASHGSAIANPSPAPWMDIGQQFDNGGEFWLGQIDELRIWNVARSQAQIQQNMNRSLTGTEAGLVAYYRFNEGFGNTTADATGHGYTGTLVNAPLWQASGAPITSMSAVTTSAAYTFSTLAGYHLSVGADGVGPMARFNNPTGIAADTNGNFFVVDQGNTTIRRISAAGVVSTIAGLVNAWGFADGVGSAARFWSPHGITADHQGNVYVTDTFWYNVRKLTPVGTNWLVSMIAGQLNTSGYRDGGGLGARFFGPYGIVADSDGTIYVADGAVRKITPVGTNWVVSTVANALGYTITPNFSGPDFTNIVGVYSGQATAISIDGAGSLYVSDQSGKTVSQLTRVGTNWVSTTIAGLAGSPGSVDGLGTAARFQNPAGLGADAMGNVYVADGGTTVRVLTPQGTNWMVSTVAGMPGTTNNIDGVGANALFNGLYGVAVDGANNLVVTDSGNNEVRKVTAAGVVRTIAGSVEVSAGNVDGVGYEARFNSPWGVALDGSGNVYVSENSTIRMITSAGIVNTVAGSAANPGQHADGAGSNARFNRPDGIAVDFAGNLYVAEWTTHTIRRITPAAVVSTTAGGVDMAGDMDGPGATARFAAPNDVAVDSAGNVFIADTGNGKIKKLAPNGTNWMVSTVATVGGFPAGLAVANDGRLFVVNGNQVQQLLPMGTNFVVSTIATLAGHPNHIAVDGAGQLYVAGVTSRTVLKLTPAGATWQVSTIGGGPGYFPLWEGGNADGAGTNALFAIPYGIAADSAGNVYVADVVNNNIRKGVFTQFAPLHPVAYAPPSMNAALRVTLVPPAANGQWRFPWELGWRNSGDLAANLVAGNYPVQFRSRLGYLAIPPGVTVAVTNGGTTFVTNTYYPTLSHVEPSTAGSLTINIGPGAPAGAGWRFLGDNTAFFPPGYTTNLAPDTYLIEFAPVSGRSKPPSQAVQVFAGLPTVRTVNYLLAAAPPVGVLLPMPVATNQITDVNNFPFGFNGQLQSDNGYGSGVAVQENVVLTAAHLVFNDQTLAYVSQAYWYGHREAGLFEPQPLAARGYYVLSGYAAQRTNDLQSGLYAPDQSTPQSRNLDAAALYFLSPVAGGGSGGFLPSDQVPNPWLAGNSLKMLVGYPVDGSAFGDASIVPGLMYQTDPQPYSLALASEAAANQQVYVAPWFLSYPGNSGGPVYAQFNGFFYPAGIYLGTLYNGVQPYASAVRAIDNNVVNLITLAAAQGDNGTNNTGGGVITIVADPGISAGHPGYVQFLLGPAAAVQAGAGWRLQGDADYSGLADYTRAVTATNAFAVEFKPIPGWNLPTNQTVVVVPGVLITNVAFYTVAGSQMQLVPGLGLGITGPTGTMHRIEYRTNLASGAWVPLRTNTLVPGFNLLLPWPLTNGSAAFYRAVWLP